VPRVECRQCGAVRQVRIGFADPRVSYTRAFERYALDLSKSMTIKDVAQHLGISWDVIKEIQKRHLKRRFGKPKLRRVRETHHFRHHAQMVHFMHPIRFVLAGSIPR